MVNRNKGSVAIEAVLSISVTMILLITLFGTLLSIYLEEESHWVAMQAIEDMEILSMPFMGHERFIQEKVNAHLLSELSVMALNRHIDSHGISALLSVHSDTQVRFSEYGYAELYYKYHFNLLNITSEKAIVLPMSASVISDGQDFSDKLVFITTYGKKYHKETCFHLRKSKFGILIDSAKEKGYESCKNCYKKEPEIE